MSSTAFGFRSGCYHKCETAAVPCNTVGATVEAVEVVLIQLHAWMSVSEERTANHPLSCYGHIQTVKLQFGTGAKKIQKEALPFIVTSAELPFDEENLKGENWNLHIFLSYGSEKRKHAEE